MIGYKLFWLVAVYWYSYSTLKKSNGDFRCYGHRTTQMVNLYIQKVSALTLYVNFVFSSVSSSCFCCPEYQCICIYNVALVRCLRTNEFCKIKTHMPSLRCGQPQQNIRWDSFLSRLTGNATSTFVISLCYNIFSLFDVLLNTSKQTSYTYSIVHLVNKNCVFQWHTAKETSCHKTIAVTSSFFPGESSRDPTKASFFFFLLTNKTGWKPHGCVFLSQNRPSIKMSFLVFRHELYPCCFGLTQQWARYWVNIHIPSFEYSRTAPLPH